MRRRVWIVRFLSRLHLRVRNEYSLEAAAKYPEQFAVMGAIKLNKPEARQILENFMKEPVRWACG